MTEIKTVEREKPKMEDAGRVVADIVYDVSDRGTVLTVKQLYDAKPHDGNEIYQIDTVDAEGEKMQFTLQSVTNTEYKPCLLILTAFHKERDFREVTIYDNKAYCWDAIFADFSSYINTWSMHDELTEKEGEE